MHKYLDFPRGVRFSCFILHNIFSTQVGKQRDSFEHTSCEDFDTYLPTIEVASSLRLSTIISGKQEQKNPKDEQHLEGNDTTQSMSGNGKQKASKDEPRPKGNNPTHKEIQYCELLIDALKPDLSIPLSFNNPEQQSNMLRRSQFKAPGRKKSLDPQKLVEALDHIAIFVQSADNNDQSVSSSGVNIERS